MGIVLARTNYGEADRIVTLLTPDQGKVRVLAKGVRKIKSRMAGGIELFSVNDITYIEGKGELCTLISSRLRANYGNIVKDVTRTMYAYEVLKKIHKTTEDYNEAEYFFVLKSVLAGLNELTIPMPITDLWFIARMLSVGGYLPNLLTDTNGNDLQEDECYIFDYDAMAFKVEVNGIISSSHIKLMRLMSRLETPELARNLLVDDEVVTTSKSLCYRIFEIAIR